MVLAAKGRFIEGDSKGEFEFNLYSDGKSFAGKYPYDGEEEWTDWIGTKKNNNEKREYMKKTKSIIVILTALSLLLLSGCGSVKEKILEKASEKVAEEMAEKATGANIDINSDGKNGVKIEKDGASFESGENLSWPKDSMGNIPEPKSKVAAVMKGDKDACSVAFSDMSKEEASEYAKALKGLGYKGGMDIADEDSIILIGENDKGETINFVYNITAKEGSITYSKVVE